MGAMASQITSFKIVYSTVHSGADKKKTSKLRVTGICAGNSPVTGNAEKASFDDVIVKVFTTFGCALLCFANIIALRL